MYCKWGLCSLIIKTADSINSDHVKWLSVKNKGHKKLEFSSNMMSLIFTLVSLALTCNAIVINQYASVTVVEASWMAVKAVDNIQ
jgi:hypothetical protein